MIFFFTQWKQTKLYVLDVAFLALNLVHLHIGDDK